MTWIKTINYDEAEGKLKKIYDRIKGPENYIDNILLAHSLRPHSLEGHMVLYKSVLHHNANQCPKWYLELVGVYVSLLNQCCYCVEHHYSGLVQQLNCEATAGKYRDALENDNIDQTFHTKEAAGLHYARVLTLSPALCSLYNIELCHKGGLDDGEILEINQVVAYFNYANRTVLGLGVELGQDILGLSPNNSDDSLDWTHSKV